MSISFEDLSGTSPHLDHLRKYLMVAKILRDGRENRSYRTFANIKLLLGKNIFSRNKFLSGTSRGPHLTSTSGKYFLIPVFLF